MSRRDQLLEQFIPAMYENSTTTVFFHTAIAEQFGLGATEEKTLLILSAGALTAGEIAQATGLTTPSVTSLIDRLEKKGFVRRVRDTNDRRRVIVEPVPEKLAELAQVFASFQGIFDDMLTDYSDDQLAAIIDYMTRATKLAREAMEKMNHEKNSTKI